MTTTTRRTDLEILRDAIIWIRNEPGTIFLDEEALVLELVEMMERKAKTSCPEGGKYGCGCEEAP